MTWIVVSVYFLCLLMICLYSLAQLHLAWVYRRKQPADTPFDAAFLPFVTVQLPLYNEPYVAERLMDSICGLDYSKEQLEIQVLDDSTDETQAIVAAKVAAYARQGFQITHICRPNRKGYKAGALAHGMQKCKGEFVAIFDADFLPKKEFLRHTIGYFADPNVGMVQTRWGHINQNFSLLTQMQAFGLDAHFTVEQVGRHRSKSLMHFNGTAGVWRKSCIEDAGGWSADTLTEDLDLSYRAQLKGWRFHFLEGLVSPAELPIVMPAIKSQQRRWNKGAAQTARKHLLKVLRSSIGVKQKLHAAAHLLNSTVFALLFVVAVLSVPMLHIKYHHPEAAWLFLLANGLMVGFFSIVYFYYVAFRRLNPVGTFFHFIRKFPLFLSYSMGLSLHNAVAVGEGYLNIKSPFVRTPKFNVVRKGDRWQSQRYTRRPWQRLTLLEGLLSLYFLYGVGSAWRLQDFGLIVFHLLLAFGFGLIFFHSIKRAKHATA